MGKYSSQSMDEVIGLRIRSRRKAIGVTQKQLAEMIGVTFQQVQKYESGKSRIGLSTFVKICTGLRTSPNYFFDIFVFNDDVISIDADLEKKLLAIFRSLGSTHVKARILDLVEAVATNLEA
jgi:transcriptional regulator with XRE-family HTH domain